MPKDESISGERLPGVPGDSDAASVSGFSDMYRVVRLLGRGTMSSVYLAEQVSMARPVALKILSPALAFDPAFVERFMREARASARLNHPNIVSALDFGEYDSRFFLAMEFIDGESLASLIKRDGMVEESRVVSIGLQIISALKHAKAHNVIHLDIKPANIMICKDGRVKLADFGLAMILDSPGAAEASQRAVGTPYYMSPEQVEGGKLDWRADQFSLGASLYEAVTGRKPFQGSSVSDILAKRFFEKPEPAWKVGGRRVSRGFSAVLAKMLARSSENRYQSLDELEKDFNRVRSGKNPVVAKMMSSTTSIGSPSASAWDSFGYASVIGRIDSTLWRKRWTWFIYSACLFLLLLASYVALHRRELLGPIPPRTVRREMLLQAENVSWERYDSLRRQWVGAMALVTTLEKDPTPESIRQVMFSMRSIVANRDFRDTAYGAAAARRLRYLEILLNRANAGEPLELSPLDNWEQWR